MEKDCKYSLEIMKEEIKNKFISPEIKYAFEASVEALEKQIPQNIHVDRNLLGTCPKCDGIIADLYANYCRKCGQRLKFVDE